MNFQCSYQKWEIYSGHCHPHLALYKMKSISFISTYFYFPRHYLIDHYLLPLILD